MSEPLKICFAASEVSPYAKTGGLADVARALPRELQRRGHDVRVFMPLHGTIDREAHVLKPVEFAQEMRIRQGATEYVCSLWTAAEPSGRMPYFVDCPPLFHRDGIYSSGEDEGHRFALFSRAVIESCQRMGWSPNLFHCNDWHTALLPLLLKTVYEWDQLFHRSKTLLTIHNIGSQGAFPAGIVDALGLGEWRQLFDQREMAAGAINFLRTGLIHADVISTVSPSYAREIQTADYGMGLQEVLRARRESLIGILNGVDYDEWNPDSDPLIPHHFSAEELEGKQLNKRALIEQAGLADGAETPLIGIVSRLAHQKGFDLCFDVLPRLIPATGLRLVALGTGESVYEEFFQGLHDRFPGHVAYYRGYSEQLAHLIEAGSDMFLMPSRYEPCGLNQMFSMRYGTIPIVRRTGGLADSVQLFDRSSGNGTGFVFDHFNTAALRFALDYALTTYSKQALWQRLIQNAMRQDYSWALQAARYVDLYTRVARA